MSRVLIALLAAAGFASSAGAQPGNLPLAPGVRPGSPYGPGMPFPAGIGPATTRPGRPGVIYFPAIAPWGWATGWGYQTYSPWTGFGYSFGGYLPDAYPPAPQEVIVEPPQKPERGVVLANEFPATLAIQFPAAAEVWLNEEPVKGTANEERVLTSPVLKPGEQFTFDVRARWAQGGKTYEASRAVKLGTGERSRLLIVSGTEVK